MLEYTLHLGDCLEIMPTLPAHSVDAIITDLPYGTTACSWDTVIPFEPMWEAVKHVLKHRGVFVTTASQPFTSLLVCSNLEWFKYEWIWEKHRATGFLDCGTKPLKEHENICVFSEGANTYNPQMIDGEFHARGGRRNTPAKVWGKFTDKRTTENSKYYPKSIVRFSAVNIPEHPTQKPEALYRYLILTYTKPGDTVLDIAAGSFTTGAAAMQTGRNFIGIEKEKKYFDAGKIRVELAAAQPLLPEVQNA